MTALSDTLSPSRTAASGHACRAGGRPGCSANQLDDHPRPAPVSAPDPVVGRSLTYDAIVLRAPVVTTFARRARASVLGVVAVSMASAAHLLAGGVVPSAEALALVVGGVAATSAPLLGVRASARRIVALVVAQQIVLHIVFAYAAVVSGRMTMGPGVISMSGMHMRHMGGPMSLSTGPAASWQMLGAHLMGDLATPGGAAMTGAHLAAAAAVGWWLAMSGVGSTESAPSQRVIVWNCGSASASERVMPPATICVPSEWSVESISGSPWSGIR